MVMLLIFLMRIEDIFTSGNWNSVYKDNQGMASVALRQAKLMISSNWPDER